MSRFITHLALERPAGTTPDETVAAVKILAGSAPMRIEHAGAMNSAPGRGFVLTVNGAPVTVKFVDKPLPPDAWEEAAGRSVIWRDAADTMRSTRSHIIVALLQETRGHPAALNGATAVTMVAGGLARRLPVAASVFAEAHAIVRGGEIENLAAGFVQGRIPDLLWTTLSFMSGPQTADGRPTTAALTTGLRPFVGREIEFQPAPLQPAKIAERLIGLSQYLIVNGPIIKDGETVGLAEKEKIRVRYAAAGRRPGVPVMEMTLETEDPGTGVLASRPSAAKLATTPAPQPPLGQRPRTPFGRRTS